MKFPLFPRKNGTLAPRRDAQAEMEKLLARSFRVLGHLMSQLADVIDHSRLEREGYSGQDRFLKRVDPKAPPPKT
jgi:hypothetical protein